MKRFLLLSLFAWVVLIGAAVWLGALNQDEGWYLYAGNCVADGRLPYRDFFYTQGPLLPVVYSAFTGLWRSYGLLGARVFTAALGLAGLLFAAATAAALVPRGRRLAAAVATFLLLGNNLYHLYFTAIPKTYALGALFVSLGAFLFVVAPRGRFRSALCFLSGLSLAFAAGARISLGALLAVFGLALLLRVRTLGLSFLFFGLGGLLGLALVYGPFLADPLARAGLAAAQSYHAARGGFDPVFTVGSASRLVRWYLPVFIVFGLGFASRMRNDPDAAETPSADAFAAWTVLAGFLAVFAVQMLAPFPYEDYQVPVMGLLAAGAVAFFLTRIPERALSHRLLLALGLAWASSFGSPLLEGWMTNGQDRFWSRKKPMCELAQLQRVAREIERLDPNGKELLTQDLYLAIETGRRVPKGLEMGPFSILSDAEWRALLASAPCRVAALSGYSFAIEPPRCNERPVSRQLEYWSILKRRYALAFREDDFGQNATPLLVLTRTDSADGKVAP